MEYLMSSSATMDHTSKGQQRSFLSNLGYRIISHLLIDLKLMEQSKLQTRTSRGFYGRLPTLTRTGQKCCL
ncbi:hypothetical protein RHMOL_Rhmol05G0167000 [Rhododendron molle]|nr:hypothetical protein RHMOL_Rhmol05G0167000 [Rhododendron molle]